MAAEQEESALKKKSPICDECKRNLSKYKCPGCSLRTCSLPCVQSHKLRTSCSGINQYNEVVPISLFDDNLLLSDYNMLENVKRVVDSGRRMTIRMPYFRLPFPLKSLRNAAARRQTKILFFSSGMSKREKNRTYYNYRKKYICWTIEWRFHSTDIVLTDNGVHENSSLFSVIENHLKPGPWKHQLRQFCDEPLDALRFFIRKNAKGAKSPFHELNIKAPIREQLANLVILEYPVIHVFLPCHTCDFEIVEDTVPRGIGDSRAAKSEDLCQPGMVFREEEIGEGGSSDTRVSDMMETTKTCWQKVGMAENPTRALRSKSPSSRVCVSCAVPAYLEG